ncbi:uncharacterized protein I206_102913 [Kwoniella pini CBS 10737]|uniref:Uncharacterized protein n=1 Tax=Kwoniella pini CBS 10737 TaxID=1296096 RepID=A0A1B9I6P3_9TREE|nr:uncharacterized protein I206_03264 [Kwoniella pini CBS 10737]OCF51198.1 hypothetical protein I206_03264 [Kwoniella pini CBS 10737]
MPLPFFLEPLLLVSYWQNRLTQRIARWFQRSNEQMFGPLEQLIAAIVILGLALQPPPAFYPQFYDWSPANVLNDTIPKISTSLKPIPSTGNFILDKIFAHLPDWVQISPVNIALILTFLNIGFLVIDEQTKTRLKESWDLFWPPWQEHQSFRMSQVRSNAEQGQEAEVKSDNKATEPDEARVDRTTPEPSSSRSQPKGPETTGAASRKLEDEGRPSKKVISLDKEVGTQKREVTPTRDVKSTDSNPKDKGKSRMDGERPGDVGPTTRSISQSGDAKSQPKDPKDTSAKEKPASSGLKKTSGDDTDTTADKLTNADGNSTNSTDTDDPLMAGDYRPLKSVLKKSKKKPKQSKNIHHNFFMTMRGYHPSLIPFPHGFHPKPHEPRNTLWWDNVPRNADHIMANVKVAKEPERDEDASEKKDKTEKGKDKSEAGKTKEVKTDEKEVKDAEGQKSQIKSGASSTDTAKEREKEKLKAQAEAKARAQKEAEAKMAKSRQIASLTTSSSDQLITMPVDPKVQKATYLSQGVLSILLYSLHPQLGFLLLTFFAWQYINSHNQLILSKQVFDPPSVSSSSSSADNPQLTRPQNTTDSMSARLEMARGAIAPSDKKAAIRGKIEDLGIMINKLRSIPSKELTPEYKDKLQRAHLKREQLISEINADQSEPDVKPRSAEKSRAETLDQVARDTTRLSVEDLEKKAKDMDQYVLRAQSLPDPTDDQIAKLAKVEERRKELWKQVRLMKGNEPTSLLPTNTDTSQPTEKLAETQQDQKERSESNDQVSLEDFENKAKELDEYVMKARQISNLTESQQAKLEKADERRKALWKQVRIVKGNEPYSFMPETHQNTNSDERVNELKTKIKNLEQYVLKHREVESPSEEQIQKIRRAKASREVLKKELTDLIDRQAVGSSGMSIDDKEALSKL